MSGRADRTSCKGFLTNFEPCNVLRDKKESSFKECSLYRLLLKLTGVKRKEIFAVLQLSEGAM